MRRPPKLLQGSRKDRHHWALLIPPCEREGMPTIFSMLFEVEQLLFKSVLFARLLLLLRSQDFLDDFFLSVPFGISELLAFLTHSLGYMKQKEKGTHCYVVPWVL